MSIRRMFWNHSTEKLSPNQWQALFDDAAAGTTPITALCTRAGVTRSSFYAKRERCRRVTEHHFGATDRVLVPRSAAWSQALRGQS
ncbi:MAG: hypothetical protein KIS66_16700 [Fimbriimonadaceae bacterium]|nr:hypothetical protein [Fimbriimonadaceae bacterium]